jgi:probable HAF family extracellular repeat protein
MPIDLGTLGGAAWRTPVAINNHGEVVGFANTSGDENAGPSPVAFIWTRDMGMRPIAPVGSDTNDIAFDLNERGQVVGQSVNANSGAARAFFWQNNRIGDLNALAIQPTSLYLTLAQGINDEGEITGTAIDTTTGAVVGFLAVPVSDGSGDLEHSSKLHVNANPRQFILTDSQRKQLPWLSRVALGDAGTK